jgi:hypothetical protein
MKESIIHRYLRAAGHDLYIIRYDDKLANNWDFKFFCIEDKIVIERFD